MNDKYQPSPHPNGKNVAIDKFCDYISNFPYNKMEMSQRKSNFTGEQWNEINDQKVNSYIVIMDKKYENPVTEMPNPKR